MGVLCPKADVRRAAMTHKMLRKCQRTEGKARAPSHMARAFGRSGLRRPEHCGGLRAPEMQNAKR